MMNIKDGQRYALIKLCEKYTGPDRAARLFIISELLKRPIESTNDLTIADWRKVRDMAYPNWVNDDWEVSAEFSSKARAIYRRYQTEVLGQLTLF